MFKNLFPRLLFVLLPVLIIACAVGGGGGDDDDNGDDGGSLPQDERNFSIGASTDSTGEAVATFELPDGANKLAVTAIVDDDQIVRLNQFTSSNGVNYLNPGGREITFADSFATQANTAIAPSRDVDPALINGLSYTVIAQTGTSASGIPVTFLINSKADGDLGGGTLRVNIFYVGEVGQDDATRQVIALAIDEFRNIYSGVGISLDIVEFDIDGPVLLPQPFDGSTFYADNSALSDTLSVNLFIGGDIEGGAGDILGISGGIPGPPNASARSGVAVGIFPGAGPDGSFSNAEVLILGETLAHESGHFLGLFHPVDFNGERAAETDPLDDTNTCRVFAGCLADDSLTSNLMFVSPVGDGSGGFVRQTNLSDQQGGVLNRNISVN